MAIEDFEDNDIENGPLPDDSDRSPASVPSPINPVAADYLQKIIDQNKQSLSDAQQKSNDSQLIASLARAGGTLAHSAYGTTAPMNESAYNALDTAAQTPVQNVLQAQKSQAQDVTNATNLQAATQKQDADDPNSQKSMAVKSLVQKLYPGKFTPDQLAAVSASDIQDFIYKPLELDEKIQERKQTHADTIADREDARSTKADEKQDLANTQFRKDLMNFRGNSSVQQAALGIMNANKALPLLESTPTSQNLNLLADEMGKIATGGVPGEHGTQALLPNNLYTKISEIKAWATGHPNASAADVTEYLNNNREYINQIMSVSRSALHDFQSNILKAYKNRLKPADLAEGTSDIEKYSGASIPVSQPTTAQKPPVVQNGHTYIWNVQKGKYE